MTTGAGLRPGAKATEQPPDPTVGAPALDSTYTIPRRDSRHRCSAEWADVDLEGAEWRYTVTKTNTPHVVPLARQAVEIRRELYPLTGYGRYVFPNARYAKQDRPMAETTLWAALRALDIPPDRMTMHGFRAMARMILDEVLGFRPDFIEHQLAHAVRDPNGRAYNRTVFLPERRVMMQAWADYLDRRRVGEEPCGQTGRVVQPSEPAALPTHDG